MKDERYDDVFLTPEEFCGQIPDSAPSWMTVKKQLEAQRHKSVLSRRTPRYAAAVVAFLMGAALFSSPTATKAFTPLWVAVQNIQDDVSTFVFGNENGDATPGAPLDTPPPGDGDLGVAKLEVFQYSAWEQAKSEHAADMPELNAIPGRFTLKQIQVRKSGGNLPPQFVALYQAPGDQVLNIFVSHMQDDLLIGSGTEEPESKREVFPLFGKDAFYTILANGKSELQYMKNSRIFRITGDGTKEEFLQIAHNSK